MPDILQAGNTYALDPAELLALRALLLFQQNDLTTRSLTPGDITAFFACVDRLSWAYTGPRNALHKGYHDKVFNVLTASELAVLTYTADKYYQYAFHITSYGDLVMAGIKSYWQSYLHGCDFWTYFGEKCHFNAGVAIPDNPPPWKQKITETLAAWGESPPDYIIDKDRHPERYRNLFDGAYNHFSGFPAVTDQIAGLWTEQWNDLLALRNLEDLDNRSFFYLLHLLIGLATAKNERTANYVARLVRTRTPTEAYPEATFINQLTYLAFLYLGDAQEPESPYRLNNAGRVALFTELRNTLISTDSGSVAIRQSLTYHLGIAGTVSDYPLLDPESSLPMSERKATTRSALLKTFKAVPPEVPGIPWNRLSASHEPLSEAVQAAQQAMISSIIYP